MSPRLLLPLLLLSCQLSCNLGCNFGSSSSNNLESNSQGNLDCNLGSQAQAQSATPDGSAREQLDAEEAALRHKALMRAHRKRTIETGKNDHAPTPYEFSPELEYYKNSRQVNLLKPDQLKPDQVEPNQIEPSQFKPSQLEPSQLEHSQLEHSKFFNNQNGSNSNTNQSDSKPSPGNLSGSNQVELRTDIKLENEKQAAPPRAGTYQFGQSGQFVSKRMHSDSESHSNAKGSPSSALTNESVQINNSNGKAIDFKPYVAAMSKKIKQTWAPPARQEKTEVSVNFILMPDGTIGNLRITKHGSPSADEAALQAILRAAPFAHFPQGCNVPKQIDYDFSHSSHQDDPSFQWGIH